jgi:replication-associated recombination protein RarA
MADEEHDIPIGLRTRHDLAADEVISALQKEIRREHTENAAFLAYEMLTTSENLEAKLWQRLQIISVEDIGYGQADAPVLIQALFQMHLNFPRPQGDRFLFALYAVRYLCRSMKDRSSDELLNWVKYAIEIEGQRPVVPDYAIDMHTEA